MSEIQQLIKAVYSRYYRQKKRAEQHNVEPPIKQDMIDLAIENYNNGFKCSYCEKDLKITQPKPNLDVFSFDHDISMHAKGSNDIKNFVICCHECNIIKGVMPGWLFKRILQELTPETQKLLRQYWWDARFAEKLDRLEHVDS